MSLVHSMLRPRYIGTTVDVSQKTRRLVVLVNRKNLIRISRKGGSNRDLYRVVESTYFVLLGWSVHRPHMLRKTADGEPLAAHGADGEHPVLAGAGLHAPDRSAIEGHSAREVGGHLVLEAEQSVDGSGTKWLPEVWEVLVWLMNEPVLWVMSHS